MKMNKFKILWTIEIILACLIFYISNSDIQLMPAILLFFIWLENLLKNDKA